eukprot:GGOE01045062.1.p1 GENE.GGOE01045062.1~~GGOE01045062.1.p1  ORF type:complete len:238 (-),score=74.19 GGOE01045062.1:393-1106(-)
MTVDQQPITADGTLLLSQQLALQLAPQEVPMGNWSRQISLIYPLHEVPLQSGPPSRTLSMKGSQRMSRSMIDPAAIARSITGLPDTDPAEGHAAEEGSVLADVSSAEAVDNGVVDSAAQRDGGVVANGAGNEVGSPQRKSMSQLPPAIIVYGPDGKPRFRLSELEMRFRLADDDDDGYISASDCAASLKMAGLPVDIADIERTVWTVPLGNPPLVDLINYIQVYKVLEPSLTYMAAA